MYIVLGIVLAAAMLALVAYAAGAGYAMIGSRNKETARELSNAEKINRQYETVLNKIANGAYAPDVEARIVLDQAAINRDKELN